MPLPMRLSGGQAICAAVGTTPNFQEMYGDDEQVSFYAKDCKEPRHMHIDRDNAKAKIWLDPDVHVARNRGYSRRELRAIVRIAQAHVKELRDEWNRVCDAATGTS